MAKTASILIAGSSYYIPVSSVTMRFHRTADGIVDSLITIGGDGRETVLTKLPPDSERKPKPQP